MAYRRNTNLGDILCQKTILNGKVKRSTPLHERKGWCSPCNSRNFNLCCQQMRNTNKHVQKQHDQTGIQNIPPCNVQKQFHNLLARMYPLRNPIYR